MIHVNTNEFPSVTLVPNTFIDELLPKANGDFVKVYIYLLRNAGSEGKDLSVGSIADALDYTEADILRALRYWEKAGVLSMEETTQSPKPVKPAVEVKATPIPDQTLTVAIPKAHTFSSQELENFKEKEGVEIDENSIFDIQIKRLHEYKRQQMNALYIIHKYLEIKGGKKPTRPLTFIFGAKAAPAYVIAQDIIHLLLCLQEIVANDPDVAPYMKVVMVENYNVSYAEKLIPACDISEQISLAGTEASGTGLRTSKTLSLNFASTHNC